MNAIEKKYSDEYTKLGLRTAPFGTTNRKDMFDTTVRYLKTQSPELESKKIIHVDYTTDQFLKLRKLDNQPDEFYVITGNYDELVPLVKTIIEDNTKRFPEALYAQHGQLSEQLCYSAVYMHALNESGKEFSEKTRETILAHDAMTRIVGVGYEFEHVIFVVDCPTEFKTRPDGSYEVIWS